MIQKSLSAISVALVLTISWAGIGNSQSNGHSSFLVFDPYDAVLCGAFGMLVGGNSRDYLFSKKGSDELKYAESFMTDFGNYLDKNENNGDFLKGWWLIHFYEISSEYYQQNETELSPYIQEAWSELSGWMFEDSILSNNPQLYFIERVSEACVAAYEMGQLEPLNLESPYEKKRK